MSMESTLSTLLKTICVRTFPDVAPTGAAKPYVTWQQIGGESLRYGDNTAPSKRDHLVQISVWSLTRLEALSLIRQIDDAICGSTQWQASSQGESASTYEPDTLLYGSIQRFSIFAAR